MRKAGFFSILILSLTVIAGLHPAAAQDGRLFSGDGENQLPERRALVIGIGTYAEIGISKLSNPVNDAKKISEELDKLGFEVTDLSEAPASELTRHNIKKAVYDFAERLKSFGGVGLIYFAGHGVEINRSQYVLPYDGYVRYSRDLAEELIPVSFFYDAFKYAGNPLNLLILDTCRNNPLGSHLQNFGSEIKLEEESSEASEVILLTSTMSGSVAADGKEMPNSPFATAFIEQLANNDMAASDLFGEVSLNVEDLVKQGKISTRQIPSSPIIGRDFVFAPTRATYEREKRSFENAIVSRNESLLRKLGRKFGGGYFYKAAKAWLDNPPPLPLPAQPDPDTEVLASAAPQPHVSPELFLRLVRESYLRDGPSLASAPLALRPAGTLLAATGDYQLVGGSYWYPVQSAEGLVAYVRTDRVSVTEPKPKKIRLDLKFQSETGAQLLTDGSTSEFQAVMKEDAPVVTRIEILGFSLQGKNRKVDDFALLERQAAAAAALEEAGYKASDALITTLMTDDPALDGLIRIAIN
jgi:hypothetical protein